MRRDKCDAGKWDGSENNGGEYDDGKWDGGESDGSEYVGD
jgi:hypothetical protein